MHPTTINWQAIHDERREPWYAIYTRHQHEKSIARMLTSKGFEVFLPIFDMVRQWKDRAKLISVPLFPCYLFICGGMERYLEIITTLGIHALVSSAGRPSVIPASEINAIRQAIERGSRIEPHPFLQYGEWVRVNRGPLIGIEGLLVRKKSACRLVLSVVMLGKAVSVEVDTSQVEGLKLPSEPHDSNRISLASS